MTTRLTFLLFFSLTAFWSAGRAEARPVVAVLAENGGTEITDFFVPYGVISSSGAADVVAVSTQEGPIDFMNGVKALADMDLARFDKDHPRGADYVIVPAFHDEKNAAAAAWLRAQSAKGATLVSICDGALVVANAGLLDGHRATAHFYSADRRRKNFPKVKWVANTRFVRDGRFISSSGVSASMPTALYIVELLAGRSRALEVAHAQGLAGYSAAHDSDVFHIGAKEYWLAATNLLLVRPQDVYALRLNEGADEIGLAFAADMLSRTFRSKVVTVADKDEIATRYGLRILRTYAPDATPPRAVSVRIGGAADADGVAVGEGARAQDDISAYLARRYSPELARFVTTQMEYPAKTAAQDFR